MVVIVRLLDIQLPMQSVPITTTVVSSSNPAHDEVYSILHYVIKFVSIGGFLRIFWYSSTIKIDLHDMTEIR